MMSIQAALPVAAIAALTFVSAAPAQDRLTVLQGAKVYVGAGAFQDGLQVAMKDGKIVGVGKDLNFPGTTQIETVDVSGRFITPGLVDANTSLGLPSTHENEQSSEITPHLRAVTAIDPESDAFVRALANGVTTVYVSPGGYNVFGGLGCVYKTAGEQRLVKEDSGLRMTLGQMPGSGNRAFRGGNPASMYYRRPTNRMGTIWEVRKAFYDAMDARETRLGPTAQPTEATRVLIEALDKKLTVRTMARADQDIRTALRLAEEFGIKVVLDEAVEAYYALDYIVAAGVPVVAAAPSLATAADTAVPHLDTVALLAKAGVPVAIQTGQGSGSSKALPLVREAGFAVRGGMSRAAALAAITSVPAQILDVADRVGTLTEHRDADVVVWSRHPLSPSSRAEKVYVDGELYVGGKKVQASK